MVCCRPSWRGPTELSWDKILGIGGFWQEIYYKRTKNYWFDLVLRSTEMVSRISQHGTSTAPEQVQGRGRSDVSSKRFNMSQEMNVRTQEEHVSLSEIQLRSCCRWAHFNNQGFPMLEKTRLDRKSRQTNEIYFDTEFYKIRDSLGG